MKNVLLISCFLICCFLSGCRTNQVVVDKDTESDSLLISPSTIRGGLKDAPMPYAVVKVFYSTDRNLTTTNTPNTAFGSERSTVKYGECDVSIPRDHKMGEIERPALWRLDMQEDPTKHISLRKILITSQATFFETVKERLQHAGKKNAFIFVHGYNVSFADAALRTAQLAYDLGFDGAPVFYSWPSKATASGYAADEATIAVSESRFKKFLDDFLTKSTARNVYLIGHSLGNRALTQAVASLLTEKPALNERLSELILAAPDIDAEVFKTSIAPALLKLGKPITLYASSTDAALNTTKGLHGGTHKIGDADQGIVAIDGIDTIDATDVNTSLVGHAYYGDSRSVLSDMYRIMKTRERPAKRAGLQPVTSRTSQTYWKFKK